MKRNRLIVCDGSHGRGSTGYPLGVGTRLQTVPPHSHLAIFLKQKASFAAPLCTHMECTLLLSVRYQLHSTLFASILWYSTLITHNRMYDAAATMLAPASGSWRAICTIANT